MENAAGGIFHIAWSSPNGGWRAVEEWESEEDAKRSVKERMLPAFDALEALLSSPPDFWPVHNYMA
jgi:quinol monooxygenase YgiN